MGNPEGERVAKQNQKNATESGGEERGKQRGKRGPRAVGEGPSPQAGTPGANRRQSLVRELRSYTGRVVQQNCKTKQNKKQLDEEEVYIF